VLAKKSSTACDGRALKANSKNVQALYIAPAFQSQFEIQAAFLARRFRLPPCVAAVVAEHAYGSAVRS
jgi:hypothetical protein